MWLRALVAFELGFAVCGFAIGLLGEFMDNDRSASGLKIVRMHDPLTVVPLSPSFAQALRFWLQLGFVSFGGPAGQIALMHQELVERRRWISEGRFLHALNYCMLLPGPEAQQLATYIGWLLHGVRGGIAAGALFVLPSLFILIALSMIYVSFGTTPVVAGVLWAVKPAVAAIVLFAAWRIGSKALKNPALWGLAAASFTAIFFFKVPFPVIVLGAGCVGVLGHRWAPQWFHPSTGHAAKAVATAAPAVIDDDTPSPAHARFARGRLLRFSLIGVALWGSGLGALAAAFGWQGVLTQMAWFFTKAALLTFGGAYAVLPYVFQGAVTDHAWLSAPQMMDGLALGETTPGPLIMVVAFVGFLGGWKLPMLGADHALLSATVAACVVTFFTFLPSFLFILIGGPVIEATHGDLHFTAPLTAITAAVVGVIVNLALFFALHALWPAGWGGQWDAAASLIGMVAAVTLIWYKLSVIRLIACCALVGALKAVLL
jgi:chromate transporter